MSDFQVEMKWECDSSIIPLIKHFTPSDIFIISKKGKNLRIDATLIGWEKLKSKRGKISLLYQGELGQNKELLFIDHDSEEVSDFFKLDYQEDLNEVVYDILNSN